MSFGRNDLRPRFGIPPNQDLIRGALIECANWYDETGSHVSSGDLSERQMLAISRALNPGELFIVVRHTVGQAPQEGYEEFLAKHADFIITSTQPYALIEDNRRNGRERNPGTGFVSLVRSEALKVLKAILGTRSER